MFLSFVGFIVTCGLTRLVHAYPIPFTTFDYTLSEAWVKAICALLSLVAAGALIWIMPVALRMISPRQRAAELERIVGERTKETEALARKINPTRSASWRVTPLFGAELLGLYFARTFPVRGTSCLVPTNLIHECSLPAVTFNNITLAHCDAVGGNPHDRFLMNSNTTIRE